MQSRFRLRHLVWGHRLRHCVVRDVVCGSQRVANRFQADRPLINHGEKGSVRSLGISTLPRGSVSLDAGHHPRRQKRIGRQIGGGSVCSVVSCEGGLEEERGRSIDAHRTKRSLTLSRAMF